MHPPPPCRRMPPVTSAQPPPPPPPVQTYDHCVGGSGELTLLRDNPISAFDHLVIISDYCCKLFETCGVKIAQNNEL